MGVIVAYVVCGLVWSTTWYAIRVCIEPGAYPTLAAAAARFSVAAALLGVAALAGFASPGPRGRRDVGWLGLAGLLCAASYALVYLAEEQIPGGLAAVVFGMLPLATALTAAWTGTERIQRGAVAGSLVGMAGIAIIFWDRLAVSTGQALSVGLVLAAVVATALYSVILKRRAAALHPLATTGVFLAAGAAGLWLLALGFERRPLPWPAPVRPTVALLYLAVFGSVVAFACYTYLVKRVRLATVSTLVFVEPVLALAVDAVWEDGVRLLPRTYLGAAVTLGAIVVSVGWRPRPRA